MRDRPSEGTARMNVTLPRELADRVRLELPGLNYSRVFQDALRSRLACEHDALVCAACSAPVARREMALEVIERFFLEAWAVIGEATHEDQGAEFIARRLRDLAVRCGLDGAANHPLPRRTRQGQPNRGRE